MDPRERGLRPVHLPARFEIQVILTFLVGRFAFIGTLYLINVLTIMVVAASIVVSEEL
jgi:hypothetical protein